MQLHRWGCATPSTPSTLSSALLQHGMCGAKHGSGDAPCVLKRSTMCGVGQTDAMQRAQCSGRNAAGAMQRAHVQRAHMQRAQCSGRQTRQQPTLRASSATRRCTAFRAERGHSGRHHPMGYSRSVTAWRNARHGGDRAAEAQNGDALVRVAIAADHRILEDLAAPSEEQPRRSTDFARSVNGWPRGDVGVASWRLPVLGRSDRRVLWCSPACQVPPVTVGGTQA